MLATLPTEQNTEPNTSVDLKSRLFFFGGSHKNAKSQEGFASFVDWLELPGTLKLTANLHLEMDGWKMLEDEFPFWISYLFSGFEHVGFGGCFRKSSGTFRQRKPYETSILKDILESK